MAEVPFLQEGQIAPVLLTNREFIAYLVETHKFGNCEVGNFQFLSLEEAENVGIIQRCNPMYIKTCVATSQVYN